MVKRLKTIFLIALLFLTTPIFAANPTQPFLPSDNVQDPHCTPSDLNCYVSTTGLAYATVQNISDDTRIAAWGDSLTAQQYPTIMSNVSLYSVYNGGVPSETSVQIKARFDADPAKHSWPTIFWVGRNNYASTTQVKADIAAMVADLGHDNYLVLSILNGSGEGVGTPAYNTIMQLNADLAATYGTHFVDVRSYLVSQYDPTQPQDVLDNASDTPPTSLRADVLHLNTAGYTRVVSKIMDNISILQKQTAASNNSVTSISFLQSLTNLLASPPPIGSTRRGPGFFSKIGIGTSSPLAALHIENGGILLTTGSSTRFSVSYTGQTVIGDPSVGASGGLRVNLSSATAGDKVFQSYHANSGNTFYQEVVSGASSRFVFLGGSIGVGTTTPSSTLHLYNNNPILTLEQTAGVPGEPGIKMSAVGANNASYLKLQSAFISSRTNAGTMLFFGNDKTIASSTFIIDVNNKRISVGTTTASIATLHVNSASNSSIQLTSDAIGSTASDGLQLSLVGTKAYIIQKEADDLRLRTNDLDRVTIDLSGNVGIGTTTPQDKLQVFGDIRLGTTGTNGCIKDYSGSMITGTCSSDERLKTDILDLSDGYLDKMANLRTITYRWNDTAKDVNKVDTGVTNYGLLAQNVEEYFPELISTDSNGYKQVNYARLPIYLLKALQELTKKVSSFADEITTKKVKTQELCVEDVCVTKQQLLQMMQNQNVAPVTSSSPQPAPTVEENSSTTETIRDATATQEVVSTSPEEVSTETSSTTE